MIKGPIHEEDIIILNVYATNDSFKIHEANSERTSRRNRRNRKTYKYSQTSQYPSLND